MEPPFLTGIVKRTRMESIKQPFKKERQCPVMKITTIGIDLAKSVFQVHGVDERGEILIKKR